MFITFCMQPCTFTVNIDISDPEHMTRCFNKIQYARNHYEGQGFINFLRAIRQKFNYRLDICLETGSCIVLEVPREVQRTENRLFVFETSRAAITPHKNLEQFLENLKQDPDIFRPIAALDNVSSESSPSSEEEFDDSE